MTLSIVLRRDAASLFSQWETSQEFAEIQQHPITNSAGEQYYSETHVGAVVCSFAVVDEEEPQLLAKCTVLEHALGYYQEPAFLFQRKGLSAERLTAAIVAALKELDSLALRANARTVAVRGMSSDAGQATFKRECSLRGCAIETWEVGICDLLLSEQDIHGHVRKSFKSLINWGQRNLAMTYYNTKNPDPALFEAYRHFHVQVAGRVTRSEKSWHSMRDWVLNGGGELALAYLDSGELVAGTMTVDGSEISFYASGVYDRSRFDRPLSHFTVYNSILRSKMRGLKSFDLGHLPAKGIAGEKEYNIGFFKRGFTTDVKAFTVWEVESSGVRLPDMTVTKTFYEKSYADLGFAAQRRYPNEELLRFMGGNFFGIDLAQRRDMKILELGCGSGANLWMVAREGFQAYGIDLSEESLKLCKMMLDSWGVAANLVSGDMSALHYKPAMFDAVLDVFSAYCLDEAGFQKCMDEVARVLKSGGRYFSYAPAKNSDAFKNYAPAYKIDDSTLNGILRTTSPYSGQTYPFRFISREEYAAALQGRGFVITSNESIGRTYRGGNEYFEFVSIAAQKA